MIYQLLWLKVMQIPNRMHPDPTAPLSVRKLGLYSTMTCYFVARAGSHQLQALQPEARMNIINKLADLLMERKKDILDANKKDLQQGFNNGKVLILLNSVIPCLTHYM